MIYMIKNSKTIQLSSKNKAIYDLKKKVKKKAIYDYELIS